MQPESTPPPPPLPKAGEAIISLRGDELEWAQARAAREGRTVGDVVTDAVRKARQLESWTEFRDSVLEDGPLSVEELEAAEREWRG